MNELQVILNIGGQDVVFSEEQLKAIVRKHLEAEKAADAKTTETPEVIEITEMAEEPETAETPEVIEITETAEESKTAETPEVIEITETAEEPKTAETPEVLEIAETAEEPKTVETPEVIEIAETMEEPKTVETPEVIEIAETVETPEVIEIAETAEEPETAETPEVIEITETIKVAEVVNYLVVDPTMIDQSLFYQSRDDMKQEWTRKIILEAFEKVRNDPAYARSFQPIIPEKNWLIKSANELEALSSVLGDHMADWVELALMWAQRIANGEDWKTICNEPDMEEYYRLVIWKDGYPRLIGGSRVDDNYRPSSGVNIYHCYPEDTFHSTVPLVISYEWCEQFSK